jgi:hypothetical protein
LRGRGTLTAGEVDLCHAGLLQEPEPEFHLFVRGDVGSLLGVEAEDAGFGAFSGEVEVYGEEGFG